MDGGKIVSCAKNFAIQLDATDCVLMAGGVDIHTHAIGPMANLARNTGDFAQATAPDENIGALYAKIGYTTIVNPAVVPGFALREHISAKATPVLDKLLLVTASLRLHCPTDNHTARAVEP